jgi:hypothetical protein
MDSKNEMTRKQFLVLTFSLVGTTAAMGSCDDDDTTNLTGTAGTSGGGTAGTTGTAGSGGTTGTGGAAGTTGTGGASAATCNDPLPETQVADSSGHTHMVTIPASALNSAAAMTFTTSSAGTSPHMHSVTLEPAQLTTLKGGGTVTVTSTVADLHAHMFTVRCT